MKIWAFVAHIKLDKIRLKGTDKKWFLSLTLEYPRCQEVKHKAALIIFIIVHAGINNAWRMNSYINQAGKLHSIQN